MAIAALLIVLAHLPSAAQVGAGGWRVILQDDSTLFGQPFFLNADTGWIPFRSVHQSPPVRRGLLHTVDGGVVWDTIPDTFRYSVERVFFVDLQHGWSYAPGLGGTISRTTDGGRSWTDISEGFPYITDQRDHFNPNAIWFHDSALGWATGDYAALLRTTDGGMSWEAANLDTISPRGWRHFDDVEFIDSLHGWAVGGNNARVMARTTDGGRTWEGDYMEYNLPVSNLVAVSLIDSMCGFAIDAYHTHPSFRTSDGGKTWYEVGALPELGVVEHAVFTDCLTGWVIGSLGKDLGYAGFVHETTDGGETWETTVIEAVRIIRGLSFPEKGVGYLGGGSALLKYGGESGVEREGDGRGDLDLW